MDQAQKELFAPSFCAFIAPYSRWELPQTLPVCGKVPEELILKHGHPPSPRRGAQSDLGCCTSEPVAADSPLSAPAQRRSGSTGGRTPLIPAGGVTRHRRHHAAAEFSGGVGSRHRSNAYRWQGLSPYCARTDLVQTKKRQIFAVYGLLPGNASAARDFEAVTPRLQEDFPGDPAETDGSAKGRTVPI